MAFLPTEDAGAHFMVSALSTDRESDSSDRVHILPGEFLDEDYRRNPISGAVKRMDGLNVSINTTSIQAVPPSPRLVDHASTEAAINAPTKGARRATGRSGRRVRRSRL